jgi:3-deoxy-D-manno-octulosonic-acid transferase
VIYLYKVFLYLYYYVVYFLAIKNIKAKQWIEGRKNFKSKIDGLGLNNCIWFHASSLGEFEQISYLIETIRKNHPHEKLLVSFFSPSGYEMKKNFQYADHVMYLPFDFESDVRYFIETIQPTLVFWVRYEFWLNVLSELKTRDIPVILLNGVFRSNTSLFYKPYQKKCLACFTEIGVINQNSKLNLEQLGFSSTIIADTRYGRMKQIVQVPFEDHVIQDFVNHDKVIICGSIWSNDDEIIRKKIIACSDMQWILVPHEVHASRVQELQDQFPTAQRYSQYDSSVKTNILIIDMIGILSRLYRFADIAYVGGGFDKVVHSLVEPLAYSLPIIIGKNIEKSEEAKEYVALNFASQVFTPSEFSNTIDSILSTDQSETKRQKIEYFADHANSMEIILRMMTKYITLR